MGAWMFPLEVFKVGFEVLGVPTLVGAAVVVGAETPKDPQYGVGGHGVDGDSKIYGEMANILSESVGIVSESFFDFIDIELPYISSLLRSGYCMGGCTLRFHCESLRAFP
jgi:hypothetical protein